MRKTRLLSVDNSSCLGTNLSSAIVGGGRQRLMMIKSIVVILLVAVQSLDTGAFTVRQQIRQQKQHAQVSEARLRRGSLEMIDSRAQSVILEESDSSAPLSSPVESKSQRLRHYQEQSAPIATSFVPTEYRPVPLLTNCHVQTIGGVFLRNLADCAYVTNPVSTVRSVVERALSRNEQDEDDWFWDERQRIDTPDGDFYHVDYKYANTDDVDGTVVLLHGLQSNSNSSLSIDLAKAYHHQLTGMNVACMNFRGCSGIPNDKIGKSLNLVVRSWATIVAFLHS